MRTETIIRHEDDGSQTPHTMIPTAELDDLRARCASMQAQMVSIARCVNGWSNGDGTAENVLLTVKDILGSPRNTVENPTPELFSPAQIEFLRRLGVRVEYCGSNQSAFNDAANFAEGRVRMFHDGLRKLLIHDESKPGPCLPPAGTCEMCNGVGFYVSLHGDAITPCPGCETIQEDRKNEIL